MDTLGRRLLHGFHDSASSLPCFSKLNSRTGS